MGIKLSSKKLCEALIEARLNSYKNVFEDWHPGCPISYYNDIDVGLKCGDVDDEYAQEIFGVDACTLCQSLFWDNLKVYLKDELIKEIKAGEYNC